jgi:polyhydroxyalkanoate synthesis regulator phasin
MTRSIPQHLTDLFHLRTEALRQWRVAFRTNGPTDELAAEIAALNRQIRQVEAELSR